MGLALTLGEWIAVSNVLGGTAPALRAPVVRSPLGRSRRSGSPAAATGRHLPRLVPGPRAVQVSGPTTSSGQPHPTGQQTNSVPIRAFSPIPAHGDASHGSMCGRSQSTMCGRSQSINPVFARTAGVHQLTIVKSASTAV